MTTSLIERLALLQGQWAGEGAGNYPTIDAFRYEERLRFEVDRAYPLIHYEQKAFLLPTRESSHWESGFIRPLEDGTIEISNSQDSGRVEVLRGRLDPTEDADLVLPLDVVVLDHDPRLVQTRRLIEVHGDVLTYTVFMSTRTTDEPVLQQHLRARLQRA